MEQTACSFSTLQRTVIGGSACPPAMIDASQSEYGVEVLHAWGMTEMSPLGTVMHAASASTWRCRRSSSCAMRGSRAARSSASS